MNPTQARDIRDAAADLHRLLNALGHTLDAVANTVPEPLNSQLVVCAAAALASAGEQQRIPISVLRDAEIGDYQINHVLRISDFVK